MINHKELSMLRTMTQREGSWTLEELAKLQKVSERSVRNYVSNINETLGFQGIVLEKSGFFLKRKEDIKIFLDSVQLEFHSSEVLAFVMLCRLLMENTINLTHFMKEFQISRTTAKNYLNRVKEQLAKHHLTLNYLKNITLEGSETDKRAYLLEILLEIPEKTTEEQKLLAPIFQEIQDTTQRNEATYFLKEILHNLNYTLSAHSHTLLIHYLVLSRLRLQKDFPLTQIDNMVFLKKSREYQESIHLFHKLQEKFPFPIPEEEFLEVINKIMGLHYSKHKESELLNWFEYDLFISKLIRRFSKARGVNLVGDYDLYESLLNHIKPAMYRIAHNINLHQFDYLAIKDNAPEEFQLLTKLLIQLHFFPTQEELALYEDEIALICVYFCQALERNTKTPTGDVLLLCCYGLGTARKLMEKIRSLYQVRKMEWTATKNLSHINLNQFQLILSTEKNTELPQQDISLVEISPFLSQEDRLKLIDYLAPKELPTLHLSQIVTWVEEYAFFQDEHKKQNFCQELKEKSGFLLQDDLEQPKHSILSLLEERNIMLDVPLDSIHQVLQLSGDLLENSGYLTPEYTKSMIESFENYGTYMTIEENVAIPHAKNQENVIKTGFSFVRLNKPCLFHNHPLSMFFSFCTLNNKDHLQALVLIADVVKNPTLKKALMEAKTPAQVLALFSTSELILEE